MTRTIAHISDLHFGRVDPAVAEGLVRDLHARQPSLVVVSGDLTQRARRRQFEAAAEYLRRLPQPQLVVPGNHDIPLYDVIRRFFFPLRRYTRYITKDLRPLFQDEAMVVFGINTARSFSPDWRAFWKGGRVSEEQVLDMELRFRSIAPEKFKVVVTHHPFLPAPDEKHSDVVQRPRRVLAMFEQCGIDLLLSGHLHLGYSGDIRAHHVAARRSILSVHAGTATSTRARGEPNTYNWITLRPDQATVEIRGWNGDGFGPLGITEYSRLNEIWQQR